MTTVLASAASWLLPPVCGGAVGAIIGRLLLPYAAASAAGTLASGGSPAAKQLEQTLADALRDLLDPRLRGGLGRYGRKVKVKVKAAA